MKKRFLYVVLTTFTLTGVFFISCKDKDDDVLPGRSTITIENVTTVKDFVQSGKFQMTGTNQPVILPGQSVTITFNAGRGQALMFATMYGFSNDLFFAPENPGIHLFDSNGNAVTGDVSSQVKLWDNGTRVNQAPGAAVQHPGTAETKNVTMINGQDEQGHSYLAASELMKLTLQYTGSSSEFKLTIENISGGKQNETPFSPGVWVVSNKLGNGLVNDKPFFTPGERSNSNITAIAESGNNTPLGDWANGTTGIITGLSPALVVVYSGTTNPIFQTGTKDAGAGLKELAQTGDASKLKASLEKMRYVRNIYVLGSSPIAPGGKMETEIHYNDGDYIALATMFGYSSDWFYGNTRTIAVNTRGDVTSEIALFDSGTGIDQYPGAGNFQALFGGTPVTEDKVIERIGNTYPVPDTKDIIKVTIR